MKTADPADVRTWARENGFDVGDRGRLPADVHEAYAKAAGAPAGGAAAKRSPSARAKTRPAPAKRSSAGNAAAGQGSAGNGGAGNGRAGQGRAGQGRAATTASARSAAATSPTAPVARRQSPDGSPSGAGSGGATASRRRPAPDNGASPVLADADVTAARAVDSAVARSAEPPNRGNRQAGRDAVPASRSGAAGTPTHDDPRLAALETRLTSLAARVTSLASALSTTGAKRSRFRRKG